MIDGLRSGGALGWLTLLVGFGAVAVTVVFAVMPSRGLRAASIALVCSGVAAGLLGTVVGLTHAFGAVAHVDPSMKAALLAQGISESMNCTAFGIGALLLWITPFVVGQVRSKR